MDDKTFEMLGTVNKILALAQDIEDLITDEDGDLLPRNEVRTSVVLKKAQSIQLLSKKILPE